MAVKGFVYESKMFKSSEPDIEALIARRIELFYPKGATEKETYEEISDFLGNNRHPVDWLIGCLEKEYLIFEEINGEVIYRANKHKLYSRI